MKFNVVRQSNKPCPDCHGDMRTATFVNNEVEVVKQWTCPHCYYRETKVNKAATKRYREENPNIKPTPMPTGNEGTTNENGSDQNT